MGGMSCNNMGGGACTRIVQVTNKQRNGKDVGDLEISRIEIIVEDINNQGVFKKGSEAGFTALDMNGQPLSLTPQTPLVVSVPVGQTQGSVRFKLSFNGQDGTWLGDGTMMRGVLLYTNDPDKPVVSFTISGTGSSPDIQITPQTLQFGNVQQGRTKTLTATLSNFGTSPLCVQGISMMNDTNMAKFVITTGKGSRMFTLDPLANTPVHIAYTPQTGGLDADKMLIANTDSKTNGVLAVPVTGGAVPCISVLPAGTLTFPTPPMPTSMPRTEPLTIANCGYGDLTIQRLQILGQMDNPSDPEIMDFSIMECGATPQACDLNMTLCPPSDSACRNPQATLHVTFQNMGVSNTVYSQLHIISNDPANPNYLETLEAHDVPCFGPQPVINVTTLRPCVGMPVVMDAGSSSPGGPGGTGATISMYNWSFSFTPGTPPTITPGGAPPGVRASFTPMTPGLYLVTLSETNNCGGSGQVVMDQMITVADMCN
jgi:hypothetical protein